MKKNIKKGFTLVELLSVIVILIVILLIAVNRVKNASNKSHMNAIKSSAQTYLRNVQSLISEDIHNNEIFDTGYYTLDTFKENGLVIDGKKPTGGYFVIVDYKVKKYCIEYENFYYVTNTSDGMSDVQEGRCKLDSTETTSTYAFSYTGNYQTFVVPRTGIYSVELWGAQGGDYENNSAGGNGNHGGYTSGRILLERGTKLYVYVGQGLGCRNCSSFNGTTTATGGGNAGGGATDIRLVSGAWNNLNSLRSRIMVAGGGGSNQGGNWGGDAGGLVGYSSSRNNYTNTGGSQVSPGTYTDSNCTACNGSFGAGSNSGATGGGGYYGGSGSAHDAGSGAGGSSFISGHKGAVAILSGTSTLPRKDSNGVECTEESAKNDMICSNHYSGYIFTDTVMIDGSGYVWTNEKTSSRKGNPTVTDPSRTENGHTGNGYAKITLLYTDDSLDDSPEYNILYTGKAATYTIPQTGKYKIELWGAQGGSGTKAGGKGAYTAGNIELTKGDILYFYVGGQPANAIRQSGGFNGGGNVASNDDGGGRAGGGATDVRLISGNWNDSASLASRIMVAAGGGGAACEGGSWCSNGGAGGTLSGLIPDDNGSSSVNYYGTGGTQTSGGSYIGSIGHSSGLDPLGYFGKGGNSASWDDSGAGGGGYYGGGGSSYASSGGGGSSYISGYTGCVAIKASNDITPKDGCEDNTTNNSCSIHYSGKVFTNTVMKSGNEIMPSHDDSSTMTGNTGNGYARITFIE